MHRHNENKFKNALIALFNACVQHLEGLHAGILVPRGRASLGQHQE